MTIRFTSSAALFSSLIVAVAAAACGGIATSPEGDPSSTGPGGAARGPTPPASGDPGAAAPTKAPRPVGPHTGTVATTDVSILYPLPAGAASRDFVRASASGAHGSLLPRTALDAVLSGRSLDNRNPASMSYDALGLVSVRLDPCSARGSASAAGTCRSEVRLVFQALYERSAADPVDPADPSVGSAATDGGVHVVYDLTLAELATMLQQILTLKHASGDGATEELGPHPILVAQGLGGVFAQGLRDIVLEHAGEDRIGRVTFFDHQNSEGDTWTFGVFDRTPAGAGGVLTATTIPLTDSTTQTVSGSSAVGAFTSSFADGTSSTGGDSLTPLLTSGRPAPGSAGVASLQVAFDAALRVQNPTLHDVQTTDCATCHLAEGARRVGEDVYALSTANAFTHRRSLARVDSRSSVTNLHAFGYLGRQVAVMQRTANESVIVADSMFRLLAPPK
jgi:hypothetical protein